MGRFLPAAALVLAAAAISLPDYLVPIAQASEAQDSGAVDIITATADRHERMTVPVI